MLMSPVPAGHAIRVWDPIVRIFHWSLVACVLLDATVFDDGDPAHRWTGYAASGLVMARVVWGFIGSRHARFSDFFPTPRRVLAHVHALRAGRVEFHVGHNPLGALMMLALLTVVLLLGITGYLQTTDAFWGENWLEEIHEGLSNTLLVLAGLHAIAAILVGRGERVNLVAAMFTGVKVRRPEPDDSTRHSA